MPALTFTIIFLLLLAANLALKLWLDARQIQHVRSHRGDVPAQFAEKISLAAHQKAADYTIAKTRLGMLDEAIGVGLALLLTLGGGFAWLYGLAASLTATPLLRDLALLVGYALLAGVVSLPLSIYSTFGVEARFGFNKMTWKLWLADLVKGLLLGIVLGLPLAALILWLMESAGTLWWLYAWLAWSGFQLLMLVLYPTVIAPLFNKFTPLEEGAVKARIEALLARCGFQSRGLFVMDGSRRSSHGNAYFTGFGAAKRIVFFDTLLKSLEPAEVEAVLAHEHVDVCRQPAVAVVAQPADGRALVLRGPWRSASGRRSVERSRAAAVLADHPAVHVPVVAAAVGVLEKARIRGRRLRRAAGLRWRSGPISG